MAELSATQGASLSPLPPLLPLQMGQMVETPQGSALQWQLRRNCCLTPAQLGMACLVILALNSVIGGLFWAMGYPVISCFAALENLIVAGCLLHYARHACDRDTITLQQGRLAIESHDGHQVHRTELQARWVRVEASQQPDALVALSERGVSVCVGRHVQPWLRAQTARELRRALVMVAH